MTKDMNMSFRKVVEISPFENSVKNLVLRQLGAKIIIDAAMSKTRVINIDETWLRMEDFRAMKWQAPRSKNSCVKKLWSPRISMLLAFDNYGESYVALSQSNTNSNVALLFLRELNKRLNEEKRNWRKDTLIYWDGASYHQSDATLKLIEELKMPIIITGPHSYDIAPCELWFAMFKKVNINPRRVKTGKG